MELRANAGAAVERSSSVTSGSSARTGSRKSSTRRRSLFVVVLPRPGNAPWVRAERVRRASWSGGHPGRGPRQRHRIDQSVDPAGPRLAQLRVLAAAGIDREALTTQRGRHLVGIQAGGVDDDPRRDRSCSVRISKPCAVGLPADDRVSPPAPWPRCSAPPAAAPGRVLPARRVPVDGDHSAATPATCGSRAWMNCDPTISRPSTPLAWARCASASTSGTSSSLAATTSLPQRSCGTR